MPSRRGVLNEGNRSQHVLLALVMVVDVDVDIDVAHPMKTPPPLLQREGSHRDYNNEEEERKREREESFTKWLGSVCCSFIPNLPS